MTIRLLSNRPPCVYCDNGLREICPIRLAIDAGLPGLVTGKPRGKPKPHRTQVIAERIRALPRAEVFRTFRRFNCSFTRTAWAFQVTAQQLKDFLPSPVLRGLYNIERASAENTVLSP